MTYSMWDDVPDAATKDQERAWVRQYQDGDPDALDKLIKGCMVYIRHRARPYARDVEELHSLCQQGVLGVIKAADRFDHSYQNRFLTYATYWIKHEFQCWLQERRHATHVNGRAGRTLARRYKAACDAIEQRGESPDCQKVADYLDIDPQTVRLFRCSKRPIRLEEDTLASGGPDTVIERWADDTHTRRCIKSFAETLDTPRDRTVWFERIIALDPKSLPTLADDWDCSKQWVHQIEQRLRQDFKEFYEDQVDCPTA